MIVATFMTSKTSAAAGRPSWMSKARIAVNTANSWQIQPSSWKKIAPAAASGLCITASPSRAKCSARRPAPSAVQARVARRAGAEHGEDEERRADGDDPDDDRIRPGGDLCRHEHVPHEQPDRDQVEHPVRDDRAGERRPHAAPPALVPGQHADAGQLADPAGQGGVGQHADAEGREDLLEARRVRERLPDHEVPGDHAHDDRHEVDRDRHGDPLPGDVAERVADSVPVRAEPERSGDRAEHRDRQEQSRPAVAAERERCVPHAASRRSRAAAGRASETRS